MFIMWIYKVNSNLESPKFYTIIIATIMGIIAITLIHVLVIRHSLSATTRVWQEVYFSNTGFPLTSFSTLLIAIPLLIGISMFLWSRNKPESPNKPKGHLLNSYLILIAWTIAFIYTVTWASTFLVQLDRPWQQILDQGSGLTPAHAVIFFVSMPIYVIIGLGMFLHARKHLYHFFKTHKTTLTLFIVLPFFILPSSETDHLKSTYSFDAISSAALYWTVVLSWLIFGVGALYKHLFIGILPLIKSSKP